MAAKLTRLTHKIAIQRTWWRRAVPFAILPPGGQSGNFWMHPRMAVVRQCSPCSLTKHHAMKVNWCIGGISLRVLDLSTRWRWVVSFTTRPLYSQGLFPWIGGWVVPRAGLNAVMRKFPAPAGTRTPAHPARTAAPPPAVHRGNIYNCLLVYLVFVIIRKRRFPGAQTYDILGNGIFTGPHSDGCDNCSSVLVRSVYSTRVYPKFSWLSITKYTLYIWYYGCYGGKTH
jgi:hypothetical protein